MTQETSDTITRVGFPIVICLWFMLRMERRVDGQTDKVDKLTTKVEELLAGLRALPSKLKGE